MGRQGLDWVRAGRQVNSLDLPIQSEHWQTNS